MPTFSSIMGFTNILEGCRNNGVRHLVYASSSSVYGLNRKMPLMKNRTWTIPYQFMELPKKRMSCSHSYSHNFKLPTSGIRLFTVYGPWGRPDMALFKFTKSIYERRAIDLYNHGNMVRDFTYIGDVIEAIARIIDSPPRPQASFDPLTEPDVSERLAYL